MQNAILALQRYWTELGCMVVQPFNGEVGAGTANPATALRVLGPEPWRVAYVEPSVRPDDSRYGENPNRLQTHTQFQVILKPDPGNPQELYLQSLKVLGIDLEAHDVRFVEDNWASPALGAWGLGWEVWLDGMEITQFTYFQQTGGTSLDPVSVEITYGLERILMALQGVSHFKDIQYSDGVTYGEVFAQPEYEMSRYYLDDADVVTNNEMFEAYVREAKRMVDLRLPVPAYTYVLRCSHTFNVLDARGAISTTQRAAAFRTMRMLTKAVADLWQERRAELGHPLGVVEAAKPAVLGAAPAPAQQPETLLFEIGFEELPWTEVRTTADQVREGITSRLAASRLAHGAISVEGTPRRIVVAVQHVAPREEDSSAFVRGPRAAQAYAADGTPTKALKGFAQSKGLDLDAIETVEKDGVEYVGATQTTIGRSAGEVLQQALGEVVLGLRSGKNMRWNDPILSYSRPIRWLLALLGDRPLPVAVSGLASGTTTRVLRTAPAPEVEVRTAEGYGEFLSGHDIELERETRRHRVLEGAQAAAARVGGVIDVEQEARLVEEITDLVESPVPLLGSFDEKYMDLPAAVLTTVMRKHQRYLPVRAADGSLMPHFVTVANGACDHETVVQGNEAVLRARFEDATFFVAADLRTSPDEFRKRLDSLGFETTLGSMADRATRIAALARTIADAIGMSDADRAVLSRAAELAKFDLATQMVVEMSSLAGTMAQEYAQRAGEEPGVVQAIGEMELPRSGDGPLPQSAVGRVLSLADRLDLLVGMVTVGHMPTGSSDAFGVRRAAIGIVNVLRSSPELSGLSLPAGVTHAAELLRAQGVDVADDVVESAVAFARRRHELQMLDAGHDHHLVRAVLPQAGTPVVADGLLAELEALQGDAHFAAVTETVQRMVRILPEGETPATTTPLATPIERELGLVADRIEDELRDQGIPSVARFLAGAEGLPAASTAFFEAVLVMDPDLDVRAARLQLLSRITTAAQGVIDWSQL